MGSEKLITAKELSRILGLSVDTIWRYTRDNQIPYIEVGPRQYRYSQDAVIESLGSRMSNMVREDSPSYRCLERMTHREFAELPSEIGYTLQLIDGLVIREPSPIYQHQRVSRRLQQILIGYFEQADSLGEVFDAPLDVYLDDYTVVQPDLFYLPSTRPAKTNPIDSLPYLVVEILSPSTTRTDRVRKLNSYQRAGVEHYWLVDPDSKIIECLKLVDCYYVTLLSVDEGILDHPDFPGLAVDVEALFATPEGSV